MDGGGREGSGCGAQEEETRASPTVPTTHEAPGGGPGAGLALRGHSPGLAEVAHFLASSKAESSDEGAGDVSRGSEVFAARDRVEWGQGSPGLVLPRAGRGGLFCGEERGGKGFARKNSVPIRFSEFRTAQCFKSGVAQWLACWAHNPKVRGPKPRSAKF